MYQDWLSSFEFQWTPILTYTRRHLALLDWFEQNIEPVAFVDRPDKQSLGVALVAPDLRIMVKRGGMILESGLSGVSIEKLTPAIEGVFEVMAPSSVLATQYLSTGVVPLEGDDYYERCAQFGTLASGDVFGGSDLWRVTDGSAVVDLTSEAMKVQVEWGIVQDQELLIRLRRPDMSRLGNRMPVDERARIAQRTKPGRDVPPVSVYADQVGFWRTGGSVDDVSDVMKRVTEAQQIASSVAAVLAGKFRSTAREEAR
jgi:hypothetical protein